MRSAFALAALAAGVLTGCADTDTSSATPVPQVAAFAPVQDVSVPVAGAIPQAQVPSVLDAMTLELQRGLHPEASRGAVAVGRLADGTPKVSLAPELAFEVDTAQMRPETLLLVANCATAALASHAVVIHVIGHSDSAGGPAASLAERRTDSLASYLVARGLPPSRVRTETRAPRGPQKAHVADPRTIELIFEPIVEGREVRAWMPPAASKS